MNFNEEMDLELRDLNLGGHIALIKSEDKGTPEDYALLESKIERCVHRNEIMMAKSKIYANRLAIC